jgi:hypothetical protein
MCGAIPPLPQYAFMAWCSVKAQGQLHLYKFYIACTSVEMCTPVEYRYSFKCVIDNVAVPHLPSSSIILETSISAKITTPQTSHCIVRN